MNFIRKGLAGLLIGSASVIGGCLNVSHSERDLTRLTRGGYAEISRRVEERADYAFPDANKGVDYSTAREITDRYGNLPRQKLTVHFVDGNSVSSEEADFTRVGNRYAGTLKRVEDFMPSDANSSNGKVLNLGNPDSYLIVDGAQKNQISRDCGIYRIGSLPGDGKPEFTLAIREVRCINSKTLNEQRTYEAHILFGRNRFEETKDIKDYVYAVRLVEDAALGWVAAGARGTIGTVADNLILGIGAAIQGQKVPDNTFITSGRKYIGLEGKTAEISTMLEEAKDSRARDVILVKSDSGFGYVIGSADDVRGIKNGVAIWNSGQDKNHIEDLILRVFRVATRASCSSGDDHHQGSSSGGGRIGGAGGNGSSSSGGGSQSGGGGGR